MVSLTIDGKIVDVPAERTILEAAGLLGIYIPTLCSHPDLPNAKGGKSVERVYVDGKPVDGTEKEKEYEGCKLCLVEVEGVPELQTACNTKVAEGLKVLTSTDKVKEKRKDNLVPIVAKHPHACMTCAQREGCSREPCSTNVPLNERCCPKLGRCELQKVAEYVGIKPETPRYVPKGTAVNKDEPLFDRDHNICIACTRCVRACKDLKGVGALGIAYDGKDFVVGSVAKDFKTSGCKFCGACAEVCPTGAITDRNVSWAERQNQLVPCRYKCPAGIDVPRYMRLIAEGGFSEALKVVRENVPFPSILGRVCFHPCEKDCRRGQVSEPMAICLLKRFVSGHDDGSWMTKAPSMPSTGKCVAIIGAGPAGLTAAFHLRRKGHSVTIFDSYPEPGGLMYVGIPRYRLPKEILKKDIDAIISPGINLRLNTQIGKELTFEKLKSQGFDAIFVTVGTQLSKRLNVEGKETSGVLWGLDFLRDISIGRDVKVNERVFVVGGGNVAVDVALSALRLGAREVQMACLESRKEMPAHEWEIQQALEEGVEIHVSWGPKKIFGEGGKVTGIELMKCTSVFDKEGRFNPSFDESVTTRFEADMVILAIGQSSDLSLLDGSGVQTNRGTIQVNPDTLETSVPGIFAGGEAVRSPGSIIDAVASGRKAASSIDRTLGGDGNVDIVLLEKDKVSHWLGKEDGFADRKRVAERKLPLGERRGNFREIELGYGEKEAVEEAKRCLRCDLRLNMTCPQLPPEKWLDFNADNVKNVIEGDGVYILLDEKKSIFLIKGTATLRQDLEAQLSNGKAKYFEWEEDPMYTKRETEHMQQYLQKHGKLPEGNDELGDLF